MAAHRFWRLHVSDNNGDGNYTAVNTLVLAETAGGSQAATGGTASASSFQAPYTPSNAFDASTDTQWWTSAGQSRPSFLQYDMGSGNSIDVQEVRLTGTIAARMPKNFALMFSDDGNKWNLQRAWSDESFAVNVERAFDATAIPANLVFNRVTSKRFARRIAANEGAPFLRISRNGFMGANYRHHTIPASKTPYSGNYFIQGSTTVLGEPFARRVDLYDQKSGLLVRKLYTKEDGAFIFDHIGPGPWTVVGVDDSAEQNSVIYAHITASPMT